MKIRFLYFIVLSLLLSIVSCIYSGSTKNNYIGNDSLLIKTLHFPNNLLQVKNCTITKIDSGFSIQSGNPKIISIIDGICTQCLIDKINSLDSVFRKNLSQFDFDMVYILNVSSKDSAYFIRKLLPKINQSCNVLVDTCFVFERQNKLLTPVRYLKTFMVDQNNRIIVYGDPWIFLTMLTPDRE